jgi:hypothetical protein
VRERTREGVNTIRDGGKTDALRKEDGRQSNPYRHKDDMATLSQLSPWSEALSFLIASDTAIGVFFFVAAADDDIVCYLRLRRGSI